MDYGVCLVNTKKTRIQSHISALTFENETFWMFGQKGNLEKNVVLWHSIRILYYSFASSGSRPNFELKSWSKLFICCILLWGALTAQRAHIFLGNLLLLLLRSLFIILVLFPFCQYAGSSPYDNICADLTWYEASAEKKSHRKIALEQLQLVEIKLGQ